MLLIVFDIEALVDVWDWLKMSNMRNSDSMINHAKHLGTFLGSMPIKLISQKFMTWHSRLRVCDGIEVAAAKDFSPSQLRSVDFSHLLSFRKY